ncbi:MAG: hypothetical protein OXC67_09380 [Flavobacteriaceae bacterium]|nr:hypothetical protein [Flavobacteriaceae bacterium]
MRVDLSFLEVAGITMLVFITAFIDAINPWVTGVLGISTTVWIIVRIINNQKANKRADEKHKIEIKILKNKLKRDYNDDIDQLPKEDD